jgi:hypothetical protein
MTKIGEAGARNETNIADANHRHAHCLFLFAAATSAGSGDSARSFGLMPADLIDHGLNDVGLQAEVEHARNRPKSSLSTGPPLASSCRSRLCRCPRIEVLQK